MWNWQGCGGSGDSLFICELRLGTRCMPVRLASKHRLAGLPTEVLLPWGACGVLAWTINSVCT